MPYHIYNCHCEDFSKLDILRELTGQIAGFSKWHRKDRTSGTFDGAMVCFRKALSVQPLEIDLPDHLELISFSLSGLPPRKLPYCVSITDQCWWHQYTCKNILLVVDMNQHLVARSFEDLLTIHGLNNHVNFTHISGSSQDPVNFDLPKGTVSCRNTGVVGSSDHYAIFSMINLKATREKALAGTIWSWNKGCRQGFRSACKWMKWVQKWVIEQWSQSLLTVQSRVKIGGA